MTVVELYDNIVGHEPDTDFTADKVRMEIEKEKKTFKKRIYVLKLLKKNKVIIMNK